jgi:AcrR family transcriptional regulator
MVGVKNNRRSQHTRRAIQETVLVLLEKKPIGSITVTEVCKQAEVNRTTFYRYYDDVFQCVDAIESEFLKSIMVDKDINPTNAIQVLLEAFYKNRKLSNLVFVEGKTKILAKMQSTMGTPHPAGAPITNPYQDEFLMQGMRGILKKWVKDGMPETPKELTNIIIESVFADNLQSIRHDFE